MSGFEAVPGFRRDLDDQALADLIDADGRSMFSSGDGVSLDRYLEAVPDLARREVPLDAAVEAVLRSMSGSSVAQLSDAEALANSHPDLRGSILDAYMLSRVIATTHTTREMLGPSRRVVPGEFGPQLSDGRLRFRLRALVGEGSFGQVYLAEDGVLSDEEHVDQVAIKIAWRVDAEGAEDASTARMEASRVRRIKHGNVARLHDRGTTEQGEEYLVFEYVEGGTLSDLVARAGGSLDERSAAGLLEGVCRGVHAAHMNGVIHHDLKPANILIDESGEPKVTDFGISISTESRAGTDRPRGNLAFASPEQVSGDLDAVSTSTDVYSIGAMLFWMLTGALAHGTRKDAIERWHGQAAGERVSSLSASLGGVRRDLRAICLRAMAPEASARYASASEMGADLRRWLEGRVIPWTRPSVFRRVWKWGRRRPLVAGALVVGLAALMFGGVMANRAWVASATLAANVKARTEIKERMIKRYEAIDLENYESQVMSFLWMLDGLNNDRIYGDISKGEWLWDQRREISRRVLTRVPGTSLEALLWRFQLVLWLIHSSSLEEETVALAAVSRHQGERLLDADDPFHGDLALLEATAWVKRAVMGGSGMTVEEAVGALDAELGRITERRKKSPLYEVALRWREKAE